MTPKQKLALEFIKAYMSVKGYAPSYRNIAQGLDIKSKSNVHRLMHALREQGFIEIKPHKIRSIQIVDRSIQQVSAL